MPTKLLSFCYSFAFLPVPSLGPCCRVRERVVVVVVVLVGTYLFACIVLPHIFQFFIFCGLEVCIAISLVPLRPVLGPAVRHACSGVTCLAWPGLGLLGLCLVLVLVLVFCGWFRFGIESGGLSRCAGSRLSSLFWPGFPVLAFSIALFDGLVCLRLRTEDSSKSTSTRDRREGGLLYYVHSKPAIHVDEWMSWAAAQLETDTPPVHLIRSLSVPCCAERSVVSVITKYPIGSTEYP